MSHTTYDPGYDSPGDFDRQGGFPPALVREAQKTLAKLRAQDRARAVRVAREMEVDVHLACASAIDVDGFCTDCGRACGRAGEDPEVISP